MSERFTLFFYVQIKPRGKGQMVPLLKFLGGSNGLENVFLAVPKLPVQPDPGRNNMNMVVVSIRMPGH